MRSGCQITGSPVTDCLNRHSAGAISAQTTASAQRRDRVFRQSSIFFSSLFLVDPVGVDRRGGPCGLLALASYRPPFTDPKTRLTIRPSRLVADPGRRRRTAAQDKKTLQRRSPLEYGCPWAPPHAGARKHRQTTNRLAPSREAARALHRARPMGAGYQPCPAGRHRDRRAPEVNHNDAAEQPPSRARENLHRERGDTPIRRARLTRDE